MGWIMKCMLALLLPLLMVSTGGWAQAATDGGFLATAKNRLQGSAQPSTRDIKPFGKDFDSDKALKDSQATIGRSLADYTFHDRNGKLVRLSAFRGKPLLISMIYTSCFHICPATTKNLAHAVKSARSAVGGDKFSIVTIGFDALHDTPERMRGFARQQGVNGERNWAFLTADKITIDRLAANTGFLFKPSSKGFDHLIQLTIVDANGRIYRQIYGMDFDPDLLTETMKELVFGRSIESLSLTTLVNKVRLYCTHYDPATGTYQFNYGMVFGMGFGVLTLGVTGFFLVRFLRYS